MGSLQGMLNLPVIGPYMAARQLNEERGLNELKQATGQMGLLAQINAQNRDAQFRQELQALGPNPTQEQLATLGARYSGPKELLSRETASLDRKAQIDATQAMREATLSATGAANQQRFDLAQQAIAARIEEAKQRGVDRREIAQMQIDGRKELAKIVAGLRADTNKPPSGYRPTAEGNLEAIPGGPADLKLQGALNQDTSTLGTMTNNMDRLEREAAALLKHPGLSKSTGLMSVVPGVGGIATIPGTDVANFKADLETLKSQAGFSVLQDMRNASKTGGALGQVSDFENRMLQANLASLDRAKSETEFKASLKKIIDYTNAAKDRLRAAYNMKHKGAKPNIVPATTISPIDALLEKYK